MRIIILSFILLLHWVIIAEGLNWYGDPSSIHGTALHNYQQQQGQGDTQQQHVSENNGNTYYNEEPECRQYNPVRDQHQEILEHEASSCTDEEWNDKSSREGKNDGDDLLPEGWAEFIDPVSGRPYYYNAVKHMTTWTRPILLGLVVEDESSYQPGQEEENAMNGLMTLEKVYEHPEAEQQKQLYGDDTLEVMQVKSPELVQEEGKEEHAAEPAMVERSTELAAYDVMEEGKMEQDHHEDKLLGFGKEQVQLPVWWDNQPKSQPRAPYARPFNFQQPKKVEVKEPPNVHKQLQLQQLSQSEEGKYSNHKQFPQKPPKSWAPPMRALQQQYPLQPRQHPRQHISHKQHDQSSNPSTEVEPSLSSQLQYQMCPDESYYPQKNPPTHEQYASSPYKHGGQLYPSSWQHPKQQHQPSGLYNRQYWARYGYGRISTSPQSLYSHIRYGGPQQLLGQSQGKGQLVSQNTQTSTPAKDTFGSAWQGVLGFGNRTKAVVEQAKDSVLFSASQVGQTVSTTSFGILGRAKASVESIGKYFFESGAGELEIQSDDAYSLSAYRIPPPLGQQQPQLLYPPQNYSGFLPGYGISKPRGTSSYPHQVMSSQKPGEVIAPLSLQNQGPCSQQKDSPVPSYWGALPQQKNPIGHQVQSYHHGPPGSVYGDIGEWQPSYYLSPPSQKEQGQGGPGRGDPDQCP